MEFLSPNFSQSKEEIQSRAVEILPFEASLVQNLVSQRKKLLSGRIREIQYSIDSNKVANRENAAEELLILKKEQEFLATLPEGVLQKDTEIRVDELPWVRHLISERSRDLRKIIKETEGALAKNTAANTVNAQEELAHAENEQNEIALLSKKISQTPAQ